MNLQPTSESLNALQSAVRAALLARVKAAQHYWSDTLQDFPFKPALSSASVLATNGSTAEERTLITANVKDLHLEERLARVEDEFGIKRKVFFESLWAIVLQHHTGSEEVLFGTANHVYSLFGEKCSRGDVYPVRIHIPAGAKFSDLTSAVEEAHRRSFQHSFLGYGDIQYYLPAALETVVYYSPVPIPLDKDSPNFPLVLNISSTETLQLSANISSTAAQHDVEILLSHFITALTNALAKLYLPHASVGSIEIASHDELSTLVHTGRSTKPEQASTITRLFEDAVRRHPTRYAIENEKREKISYTELNRTANKLARSLNLVRGAIYPISMERSIDMLVTMIAVLKAGAVYTILDPEGPQERNSQILQACGSGAVLCHEAYIGSFDDATDVSAVLATLRSRDGDVIDDSNLALSLNPKDNAYIIWTSGSTGRPKGVVLTHGAASNGMAYHNLNGRDRWLLFYNPTFSAAQRTMLSTLVHGGTLIVAPKKKLQTDLSSLVKELRVQSLGITPSALSTIRPGDVPNVEQITLVGESINQELVAEWADHVELKNTYGLSEVTQLNFGARLKSDSNPRVVGRTDDTTSAYILVPGTTDLAPSGIAGEIGLAGPQLGKGYLNDPERTDKVFIDNPFGPGKLYRTGDLGRRTPDGSFEVLGRIDYQAKIAGQKVEPSEVNAALVKHTDIVDAITVAADVAGRIALVTGLVIISPAEWSTALPAIRKHAEHLLPAYMVPSYWLPLTEVPKNINGKMDLLRFKTTVQSMTPEQLLEPSLGGDSTVIHDPLERSIATVWAKVLGLKVESIKREHSFLTLGGSSITAIKSIAELRLVKLEADLNNLLSDMTVQQAASAYRQVADDDLEGDISPFELIHDQSFRQKLTKDQGVLDAYPATALQYELFSSVGTQQDPYTYRRSWTVAGLDLKKLEESFKAVFNQSDILRSTFVPHGKSLFQVVRSDLEFPWATSDLDHDSFIAHDESMPLPQDGPLFRVTLLRDDIFVVSMHHVLFDFWSFRFLYQDVAAIYRGLEASLRPKFSRFIRHISKLDETKTRRFWKKELTGAEPTVLNHAPLLETTKLAKTLHGSLREDLRKLGVTMGAVLYTAWALVLHKQMGNPDVTFMTSFNGREAPVTGINDIDGPTLTMAPQRTRLDSEQSLLDLTKSVGANVRNIIPHAQYGLRRALSAAGLQQEAFDTFLNYVVAPEQDPTTGEVFKRFGTGEVFRENIWTTMEVEERADEILLRLAGKLEPQRLGFIMDSFVLAIMSIVQQPDSRVSDLDIIGSAEQDFLYNVLSNRKTLKQPEPELLHARLERHAAQSPDDIAIDWQGVEQVSYAELDRRANQLAHGLVDAGTRSGDRIPLLMDKSIDTLVAILGVMKAGAAYIPLNPENPVERNLYIVQDVEAKTMIMHSRYVEFCSHHDLRAVMIDHIQYKDSYQAPPATEVTPDDLAYLIYTSGSTGQPKGVKVPHRSAAAAVTSMEVAEGRGKGEWRTLQFANYVFDASVQDFFNTLSTGGTLCMAPQDVLLSDLAGVLRSMRVKQAIITPTVAKLITPAEVPTFTTLIVGGEPLTSDVVNIWSGQKILNVYGPTECSMVVTTKDVTKGDLISNIGAPFPTVMAFILDPNGTSLVPYGAVGELCIAGPQVTDGYLNRPDLTDAAFIDGKNFGVGKLYRTGDLARWLPGGEISCLGRKDGQVKIHGHRIELGEIEVAIIKTELVDEAAVVVTDVNGKPSLVAFCVFDPSDSPIIEEANGHVKNFKRLREGLDVSGLTPYMIPNYILPVGQLPKLPSRKIDRKTLKRQAEQMDATLMREYALSGSSAKHDYVAPENEREVILEELWSKILSIPASEIGRKADLKALGGDSISAISLSSAASKAGYTLSVNNILKKSRLHDMAAAMQQKSTAAPAKKREFVMPAEVRTRIETVGLDFSEDVEYVYPCPPGQAEFVSQGSRPEQMWALIATRRMPQGTNLNQWISATTKLIEINDILRTSWLQVSSGEWLGVVLASSTPDLITLDVADEDAAQTFIETFWAEAFVFGKPFIKFALLKYPDGSFDTVVKLNHAVYDGTLLRIFDDHFGAILTSKPIPEHGQFKDFAFHVYSSDKSASLAYWKQAMSGRKTSYLSSISSPKITAAHRSVIDTNLDTLSTSTGVSPSAIFQAAYELWLSRTSADLDVNFDYLLSGRNVDLPNLDPMTINGTLATFLPIRHRISEETTTLNAFLQTTQENFWAITDHASIGLSEIYTAASLSRSEFGNKTLFLFQPFEPAGAKDEERWLILAKSKVRMYQPYALVVEVAKGLEPGKHKLAVMYDGEIFGEERGREISEEIRDIVERFAVEGGEGRLLKDV